MGLAPARSAALKNHAGREDACTVEPLQKAEVISSPGMLCMLQKEMVHLRPSDAWYQRTGCWPAVKRTEKVLCRLEVCLPAIGTPYGWNAHFQPA